MSKVRECPKCRHPKSKVETYDGDYWRICLWCGMTTRCPSKREANEVWNDRSLSPDATREVSE